MKTKISTLVVISLLILTVFSFYQIQPAKATVQTTYLSVNQFTADDSKWIKVGSSPYLDTVDYPTNYILSRSDRPSESGIFQIQSPVNWTGQYANLPEGRIDYYAKAINGSNEVFRYDSRSNPSTDTIGSTWAWKNTSSFLYGFANMYQPSYPSGGSSTGGFTINNTIRGTLVTITTAVRVAYVTTLASSAGGSFTTKMAIYDTSYNYIDSSTEYTTTDPSMYYNFPTCPYLVAGTYWFTWWATKTTANDITISNYTKTDQLVNFNFYQPQTYGSWPTTLSPTFANGSLQGSSYTAVTIQTVPSSETITVCFDKRYVGAVAIDKVVATFWNTTTTCYQTCSGFIDADPSFLKTGDAPYLDISDYPTNYISYTTASGLTTDIDCFYTFSPTSLSGITDVKLDFNGSGTIRYYLLSSDMSINYTNSIAQTAGSWVSADIFAYVPNATFINKLRIALRLTSSGYTDAMRLEVIGDYESLNLLIQDSSGNPISGAVAEFVDGGDVNITSSSTGWANLTGILLNTNVTVKVAYQDAWVNGTFTVNMTADKNVNVTCKVYSLTVYLQTTSDSPIPYYSLPGATLTLTRNDLANLTSYGLTPQLTTTYNLTHAAYTWNQLANQTYQITANIANAGAPKSSIVDLQASNSTFIQLVYPVGGAGPGPGPGPITPETPSPVQKILEPILAPAVTLANLLNNNKWPIILLIGISLLVVVPYAAIKEKNGKKKKDPFRRQE